MTGAWLGYSFRTIESGDTAKRIPRRLQSQAAAALLSALQTRAPSPALHSKSHSRAVVAVALGQAQALGIDIEWIDTTRPLGRIASYLEWGDIDRAAFYRGWTFREAYYKAFQRNPSKDLAARAMEERPDGTIIEFEDGVRLFQRRVLGSFQLGLVWKSAGSEVVVPAYLETPMV